MKESSEQHIVIKTHNTQMQNSMNPLQNSHNTAQNSKDPSQESQNTKLDQHRPSPAKNRSRRKGRGGTKSVLSDVSMHPISGVCHFNGPVSTRVPTGSVDNCGHVCDVEMGVPSSSKSLRFPLRPGYGQAGVKCIVKANHFLTELPDKDLNHYDVRHYLLHFSILFLSFIFYFFILLKCSVVKTEGCVCVCVCFIFYFNF